MCHSRTWNNVTNKFYEIDLQFGYDDRQSGFEELLTYALSGLRKLLAIESSLKVLKNVFNTKALYVLKIFRFLSWIFGHVEKRLDHKDGNKLEKKTSAIHIEVQNTHRISQEVNKIRQKMWSVNRT